MFKKEVGCVAWPSKFSYIYDLIFSLLLHKKAVITNVNNYTV